MTGTPTPTPERPPTAQTINGQPIGGPGGPKPPSGLKGAWRDFRRMPKWAQIGSVLMALVILGVLGSSEEEPKKAKADKPTTSKAAPKTPSDPLKALENSIAKNVDDEIHRKPKRVACTKQQCEVEVVLDELVFGKKDEVAKKAGGILHELYRDTRANNLFVTAYVPGQDELGKEIDVLALELEITRAGWGKLEWDNLKNTEPQNIEVVAKHWLMNHTLDD